jgi:hypothetical protein
LTIADAGWFRGEILLGVQDAEAVELETDRFGMRFGVDLVLRRHGRESCGKNCLDCSGLDGGSAVRNLLDSLMGQNKRIEIRSAPKLFDIVEFLSDHPASGLEAGAIGTIVEALPDKFYIVEFLDADGRTRSLETLPVEDLSVR